MDRYFLRSGWNDVCAENSVSKRATELGLQFVALVLGGRTAREMLLAFYVKGGLEEGDAQALIAAQSAKVRTVMVVAGAVLILAGGAVLRLIEPAGDSMSASLSIYLGIFLLACQLPRGTKASASWDSIKTLFKK